MFTRNICSSCLRSAPLYAAAALPRSTGAPTSGRWAVASVRAISSASRAQPATVRPQTSNSVRKSAHSGARRFATTANQLKAATVLQNPRVDEDGNEMTMEITERAATRLKQIMAKESTQDLALRITVEAGGCHGFQYLMSLVSTKEVDAEEDTVFQDSEYDTSAKVVLDQPSLDLLKGSKVDYTMELIGSQFKVDNPLASSSCGCGTSFDIKA